MSVILSVFSCILLSYQSYLSQDDLRQQTRPYSTTFKEIFLDSSNWKIERIKGEDSALHAKDEDQDFCTAKWIKNSDDAISFGFIGKSSHCCDSLTQFYKSIEIKKSISLEFSYKIDHAWGKQESCMFFIRVLDNKNRNLYIVKLNGDGKKGSHKLTWLVEKPTSVKVVFDTTCRSMGTISDFTVKEEKIDKLKEKERTELQGLIKLLSDFDPEKRDKATEQLISKIESENLAIYDMVKIEFQQSIDTDARARLEHILYHSKIIDLKSKKDGIEEFKENFTKNWKIERTKGEDSSLHGENSDGHFCKAKWISSGKGNIKFGFVGEGSHCCDSLTQFCNSITLKKSISLEFNYKITSGWGKNANKLFIRLLNQKDECLYKAELKDKSHKLVILVNDTARLKIVLDTRCRTEGEITDINIKEVIINELNKDQRKDIKKLSKSLSHDDPRVRDKATNELANKVKTGSLEIYEFLKHTLQESKDPEAKSRLEQILQNANHLVDLRYRQSK